MESKSMRVFSGGGSLSGNKFFSLKFGCYKKGFTLAEVLITLGIIGVVAAMTMPVLVGHYKSKVLVTQAQKSLSMIMNAISMAKADIEVENNGEIFLPSNSHDETAATLFKYMNVVKTCKSGDRTCIPDYKITQERAYNDGYGNVRQPSSTLSYSRALLADGSIVGVTQTKYKGYGCLNHYTTWDKDSNGNYILDADGNKQNERKVPEVDCGHVYFDTNGLKAPNQYGADVYLIYIQPYSYIQSLGHINNVIKTGKITAIKVDNDKKFK